MLRRALSDDDAEPDVAKPSSDPARTQRLHSSGHSAQAKREHGALPERAGSDEDALAKEQHGVSRAVTQSVKVEARYVTASSSGGSPGTGLAISTETSTQSKMAAFLNWSFQDVAQWVESLGYPQYKACFTENFIDGKKLIYINCQYLPRIGITDFGHMRDISKHVRDLLNVQEPLWSRSIALPRRDPMALFLEVKSHTGAWADSLTYTEFLQGSRGGSMDAIQASR
ncbi:sterile alpha motif domain-containing protein 15 isoform X1 [Arapaima gigas]